MHLYVVLTAVHRTRLSLMAPSVHLAEGFLRGQRVSDGNCRHWQGLLGGGSSLTVKTMGLL